MIKKLGRDPTLKISGTIVINTIVFFVYLMWYVTPEEHTKRVKGIVVIETGYLAETYDEFSVNISDYRVQSGEYVNTIIDKKVKERTDLMNPTR